jgi:pimeloyl-ACP methyl ester carboxylesterase
MEFIRPQGTLVYDDTLGDGPLVVCLPGMGDNRATYRHLTPLLVAAGHRVVTLDLRGQGESDAVWPDYSPEAVGADLLDLLRHLDAGPAVLITNSYTGATAVWAAAEAPSAFAAIVLTDPFARVMPAPGAAMRLAIAAVVRVRPFWMMYWSSLFKTASPRTMRPLAQPFPGSWPSRAGWRRSGRWPRRTSRSASPGCHRSAPPLS